MQWLSSFTGLIPVALAVPLLIFHQWAIATLVSGVSAVLVIAY
jgi:hypothetical protein